MIVANEINSINELSQKEGRKTAMSHIIRQIPFGGWKNCIQISNTVFDAVITTEVGPRIVRYGKVGGPNLLWLDEFTTGSTEETKTWRAYGGRSFDTCVGGEKRLVPENVPVAYTLTEDAIVFDPINQNGLEKQIKIRMCRRGGLEINQMVTNKGEANAAVAILGGTMMPGGGMYYLPGQISEGHHRPEVLYKGNSTPILTREETCDEYRICATSTAVWCGVFNRGSLLMITCPEDKKAEENLSLDVTPRYARLEICSPEKKLKPGDSLTQTEVWNIFPDIPLPESNAAAEKEMSGNRWFYDFVKKPVKGLDY